MHTDKHRSETRKKDSFFSSSVSICVHLWLIFLLLGTVSANAQLRTGLGWVWQNPLPQGNPLYAIGFAPNKENGFAVGSDNTILATNDGGFSWRKQTSLTDVTFSGVFVRDKANAFVVGARGTVLTTVNGGKEWKAVAVDTRDHLSAIEFTGEGVYAPALILRQGRWKYVYCEGDPGLLFDLQQDPSELRNLCTERAFASKAQGFVDQIEQRFKPAQIKQQVLASQRRRLFLHQALTKN